MFKNNKKIQAMISKFSEIASKIAANEYILIIFQGVMPTLPLLMICSIFMIIVAFPVEAVANLVGSIQIGGIALPGLLVKGMNACYSILGLLMNIGISYSYAKIKKLERINLVFLSLASFILIMPYKDGLIDTARTGSDGILIAMIIALLVGRVYEVIHKKGWKINMPKGTPQAVTDSFIALIPSAIVIFLFFMIYTVFTVFNTNAFDVFNQAVSIPLGKLIGSLGGYMLVYAICPLFWAIGVNSPITYAVCQPFLLQWDAENIAFFTTGVGSPNIINSFFHWHYIAFGGGGCVLALIAVMFLVAKSERMKKIRSIGVIPSLFNISEPIVYGLPIMLNPYMVVPLIVCPLFNIVVAYYATKFGIVAYTSGVSIPWTTPVIISGFLAGGVSCAILQAVLFVADMLIYLPFTIALDKVYLKDEEAENIETVETIDLNNIDLEI